MTTERYAEQFLQCALDTLRGDLQEILDARQILRTARLDPDHEQAIVSRLIANH